MTCHSAYLQAVSVPPVKSTPVKGARKATGRGGIAAQLAAKLAALTELQSMAITESPTHDGGCAATFLAAMVHCKCTQLTRLEIHTCSQGDAYDTDGHVLWISAVFRTMISFVSFWELRQLVLPLRPQDHRRPDVAADFQMPNAVAVLTTIEELSIVYDVEEQHTVIQSATAAVDFLKQLANLLQPLQNLKVLKMVCSKGVFGLAEYELYEAVEQGISVLKGFIEKLDEVVVRGVDGDIFYPFARKFEGVRVIKSMEVIDQASKDEDSKVNNAAMISDCKCLQSVTALRLRAGRLNQGQHPDDQVVTSLKDLVGSLLGLRQVSISQSESTGVHQCLLIHALVLPELRQLHFENVRRCSWQLSSCGVTVEDMGGSLTSLTLENIHEEDMGGGGFVRCCQA